MAEQTEAQKTEAAKAAETAAATEAAKAAAAKPKRVEARVLIDFDELKVNDVIAVDADVVESLKGEGKIDDAKAAVAYAKSLIEG